MTAKEFREWLAKQALSPAEFAKWFGVTEMAVCHWRSGERSISVPISRLLRLLEKHPKLMGEYGK